MKWFWLLLALVLIVILLWWACPDPGERPVGVPQEEAVVAPEAEEDPGFEPMITPTEGEQEGVPIGMILASPGEWQGRSVSGDVSVSEVPTDRAFWIEQEGQRMLALIVDEPQEEPKDINAGQMLSLSAATVRSPADIGQLPGDALEDDTRRIAEQQPAFLVINESDIAIQQSGTPGP